jgi:hypothetical protein
MPPNMSKNFFKQNDRIAQPRLPGVCWPETIREKTMTNVLRLSKRLIPIEHIVLFEPFVAPVGPPLSTSKEFKARVVLLDRVSILAEEAPEDLASTYGFRMISEDRVATNPEICFGVETFEPGESFQSSKPFKTRLVWKGPDGTSRSKLLVAEPATVLEIAVRGELDPTIQGDRTDSKPATARRPRPKRRPALAPKTPA